MNRVIEKLKTNDSTLKLIADELIKRCEFEPVFIDKIINEKKSLDDCLDYIKSEAKKTVVAGVSVVDDATVFGWAIHYFDEENLVWEKAFADIQRIEINNCEDNDLDFKEEKLKKELIELSKKQQLLKINEKKVKKVNSVKKKDLSKQELLAVYRKQSKVVEGQVSLF